MEVARGLDEEVFARVIALLAPGAASTSAYLVRGCAHADAARLHR